jgi:hypothetical protein
MAKAAEDILPKAVWCPPLVPLGCALDCLHDKALGALTRPLSHRRYSAAILLDLLTQLARLGARVRGNVDRGREQWIEPAELVNDWRIGYWTAPARGRARIAVPKLVSRYKYPTERVVINVVVESKPLIQTLQHVASSSKRLSATEPLSEPHTKRERLLLILEELNRNGRLEPDLKPAAVERLIKPPYYKHWGNPPSRREIARAYKAYLAVK